MTAITVRIAQAADADVLARLSTQLGYPADSVAMPARLERLERDANARAFVALSGDAVVGMATIHLRYTMNHESPIAQLTLLVVDESVRTRGVGRALVQAAEQFARERGAKRINVTTALQRSDAHAFYERIGYVLTGRRYGRNF
ncbi:MAG: GNAT family N-acetyltransferase [Gemmatimonadaceae bacterium]